MMMPMRLGSKLVIRREPLHAHTDAVANLQQAALADPPAVGHDVDRALARFCQRQHIAWTKPSDLSQRHLEAPDFEDEADRHLIERRLVNRSARQGVGWIL